MNHAAYGDGRHCGSLSSHQGPYETSFSRQRHVIGPVRRPSPSLSPVVQRLVTILSPKSRGLIQPASSLIPGLLVDGVRTNVNVITATNHTGPIRKLLHRPAELHSSLTNHNAIVQ